MPPRIPCILVLLLLSSCESTPDSNPVVFQTPDQTVASRRAGQIRAWKDSAVQLLTDSRPDLSATPGQSFNIIISADGASRSIDLSHLEDRLRAQPQTSLSLLKNHLDAELPNFDQQRLSVLPFDSIRDRLTLTLLSSSQLDHFNNRLGDRGPLPSTLVAPDIYAIPAISWPKFATSLIAQPPLKSWNQSPESLHRLALENLRRDLSPDSFETITLGPNRVGHLRPGTNPAILLLPDFLSTVRSTWSTSDDLVILLSSTDTIQFLESQNRSFLDTLYPRFADTAERTSSSFSPNPLLLSNSGLTLLPYNPPIRMHAASTRPLAMPQSPSMRSPTSRPTLPQLPSAKPTQRPYIAR